MIGNGLSRLESDVIRQMEDFYDDGQTVCPNCGSTLDRCEAAKKRGCIACCPDCDHSGKGGAA